MHGTMCIDKDNEEDPEKAEGVKKVLGSVLDKMQPLRGKTSGDKNSKKGKGRNSNPKRPDTKPEARYM